ncbi:MAG TPA: hypothetical protein VHW23_15360 [Kofleriaceae bacterium]|jgi:hypothetical protein|nr:hypothetical protein [Kofleriaceae bacterium]
MCDRSSICNTATWRLGPGGWKLIAMQVLVTLLDPPAIVQRDAGGRITGFADRREARDVVWTRLP